MSQFAGDDSARRGLVADLKRTIEELAEGPTSLDDLAMVNEAIDELHRALSLFVPYRARRKLTIFGSARTPEANPIYDLAAEVAAEVVAAGWMVVTGAGPGVMEAGSRGAGHAAALGVNIALPFEQGSNPYLDADKVTQMRYFFTRKVMLMRESHAFVCLPGGLGTLDETFELLTLLQTGKIAPAPLVLLEPEGGTFWEALDQFLVEHPIADGWISAPDRKMYRRCHSARAAAEVVLDFYANLAGLRFTEGVVELELRTPLTTDDQEALAARFGAVLVGGTLGVTEHEGGQQVRIEVANGHHAAAHELIEAISALGPSPHH